LRAALLSSADFDPATPELLAAWEHERVRIVAAVNGANKQQSSPPHDRRHAADGLEDGPGHPRASGPAAPPTGQAEADTTFVGGAPKPGPLIHSPRGKGTGKARVLVVSQRGGPAHATVIAAESAEVMGPVLRDMIDQKSTPMTDGDKAPRRSARTSPAMPRYVIQLLTRRLRVAHVELPAPRTSSQTARPSARLLASAPGVISQRDRHSRCISS
jgi:hypothetical protein